MNHKQIIIEDLLKRTTIERTIQALRQQYDYDLQVLEITRNEQYKLFNTIIERIQKESENGISDSDRLQLIGLRTETMENLDKIKKQINENYSNAIKELEESFYK